jgi:hypothetical protein
MTHKQPKKAEVRRGEILDADLRGADLLEAEAAPDAIPAGIVKDQLARLLASSLFNRSDRYPAFLTFVVESVLRNPAQRIKEQAVGIGVFDRAPGYDTDRDHIVRSTAVEIRKRLRQYYAQPEHRQELVIDLPVGSYTPHFLKQDRLIASIGDQARARVQLPEGAVKLWKPMTDGREFLFVCISPISHPSFGDPVAAEDSVAAMHIRNRVALADAVSMSRVVSFLSPLGVSLQIVGSDELTFDHFDRAPVVLIGALNNKWAQRLTKALRFSFRLNMETQTVDVVDELRREGPVGSVGFTTRVADFEEDFAIITRLTDPKVGKPVLAVGGVTMLGTAAAAEFVTNPQRLAGIDDHLAAGWQARNLQVLLSTRIIEGRAGPAQIVACADWDE